MVSNDFRNELPIKDNSAGARSVANMPVGLVGCRDGDL